MTPPLPPMARLVLVTGLSGAGKSSVLHHLEDQGFTWVDNLPLGLIPQYLDHFAMAGDADRQMAIGPSFRDHTCLERFRALYGELTQRARRVDLIFLEANHDLLVTRYRETRRRHPMVQNCTVKEAIQTEARHLMPLRALANLVLDTTHTSVPQLKQQLNDIFRDARTENLLVFLRSFGFKHGVNTDPDMVLDARFLSNPHYKPELRPLTGCDDGVIRFLEDKGDALVFLDHIHHLFTYLLPLYRKEGKRYLTVDIGCTGGRHRSVFLVERLASLLREQGETVFVRHRDMDRQG